MICTPRLICCTSLDSSASSVSPHPLIAVSGVRSSWDTEEMNSDFIRSLSPIFRDISLMLSTNSPISSEYLLGICTP